MHPSWPAMNSTREMRPKCSAWLQPFGTQQERRGPVERSGWLLKLRLIAMARSAFSGSLECRELAFFRTRSVKLNPFATAAAPPSPLRPRRCGRSASVSVPSQIPGEWAIPDPCVRSQVFQGRLQQLHLRIPWLLTPDRQQETVHSDTLRQRYCPLANPSRNVRLCAEQTSPRASGISAEGRVLAKRVCASNVRFPVSIAFCRPSASGQLSDLVLRAVKDRFGWSRATASHRGNVR